MGLKKLVYKLIVDGCLSAVLMLTGPLWLSMLELEIYLYKRKRRQLMREWKQTHELMYYYHEQSKRLGQGVEDAVVRYQRREAMIKFRWSHVDFLEKAEMSKAYAVLVEVHDANSI